MRAMALNPREAKRDWQLVVAVVFLALTLFGAVIDRRNALVDRSVASARPVANAVSPATGREMVQEMMTHD